MTKSALQVARAAYQPKLPKALQSAVAVKEGAATQSVANQDEIKQWMSKNLAHFEEVVSKLKQFKR